MRVPATFDYRVVGRRWGKYLEDSARMDAVVDCPQSVDTAKTFVTTIICPHAHTAAPPHGLAAVGVDMSTLKESTLHKIESGWKCVEWLCKGPPEKPAPYSLVMQVM